MNRPPSLRGCLDAGLDLTQSPDAQGLAEALAEMMTDPPQRAERQRFLYEAYLEALLTGEDRHGLFPPNPRRSRERERQMATLYAWKLELMDDIDLRQRVLDALPEARRELDLLRRQNPLEVEVPSTWWSCHNCGAAFDEGVEEAVSVGFREGFSELSSPIHYCRGCIALVAAVMGSKVST